MKRECVAIVWMSAMWTTCVWTLPAQGAVNPSPVATVSLPAPGANSYTISARYDASGLLHVWDGQTVWKQTGLNANAFSAIGGVDLDQSGSVNNSSDAGPISFSQDGSRILLGNAFGGVVPNTAPMYDSSWCGLLMSMPAAGQTVTGTCGKVMNHVDAIALPAGGVLPGSDHKYLVDQGNAFWTGSLVSIFDDQSGSNVTVIKDIPGAAASLAVRDDGRLFATIGYGAARGQIRSFAMSDIEAACVAGTPLNWTAGERFTHAGFENATSGAGMFFDSRGYLFAGGNEGVTVYAPDGWQQSYNLVGYYTGVAYNAATDQFMTLSDGKVYNTADFVPEPSSLVILALAGLAAMRRRVR